MVVECLAVGNITIQDGASCATVAPQAIVKVMKGKTRRPAK